MSDALIDFYWLIFSLCLLFLASGKVFVNGKLANKAGNPVSDDAVVEIRAEVPKYVCR